MRRILLTALLFVASLAMSQDKLAPAPGEATATVPALEKFHEVIFTLWHDAWPTKNTEKLIQLLPDIQKGVAEVANAELPGILREKKSMWEKGIGELRAAADAYQTAAAQKDGPSLLDAAERLHARYEGLVRLIRPVLKEIEEFHGALYPLYHYYLPQYSIEKIKGSAIELKSKMHMLRTAVLPDRLKAKSKKFDAARNALAAAVDALNGAVETKDETTIRAAVNTVHGNYEALTRVFEE